MKKLLLVIFVLCLCGCSIHDLEYFYSHSAHRFDLLSNVWFLMALAVVVYCFVLCVKFIIKRAPKWVKNIRTISKRRKSLLEKYRKYIINCDKNGKEVLNYKQWKFAYVEKKADEHFAVSKKKVCVVLLGFILFVASCVVVRFNVLKHYHLITSFGYCMSMNYARTELIFRARFRPDVYRAHCDNIAEEVWEKHD